MSLSTRTSLPQRDAPRQLAFEFDAPPRYGEEDFLVSPANAEAYALVAHWPDWPDFVATIAGPPASGKSHLAAIWARRAQAVTVVSEALRADSSLGAFYGRNVLLENADRAPDERGLFHLFNLVQEAGTSLLLTATSAPDLWAVKLPDLRSRLRRAPVAAIAAPDEALIEAVLVKLFADRQLLVDAPLIHFLTARLPRSIETARALVAELDRMGLEKARPVTRALAQEALRAQNLDVDEDEV
jgi:chromosomal replication initiation ATPase DnaA